LLSKHRKEGGEEGSGEARVKDSLDLDDHVWGTGPLREGGRVVSEGGIVDLVDEDTEEGGSLTVRVGSELGLDIDDEYGGDGGEQTSLWPSEHVDTQVLCETHEYQSCAQITIVLVHELPVIPISLPAIVFIESRPVILLRRQYVLFPVARGVSATFWPGMEENSPVRW